MNYRRFSTIIVLILLLSGLSNLPVSTADASRNIETESIQGLQSATIDGFLDLHGIKFDKTQISSQLPISHPREKPVRRQRVQYPVILS